MRRRKLLNRSLSLGSIKFFFVFRKGHFVDPSAFERSLQISVKTKIDDINLAFARFFREIALHEIYDKFRLKRVLRSPEQCLLAFSISIGDPGVASMAEITNAFEEEYPIEVDAEDGELDKVHVLGQAAHLSRAVHGELTAVTDATT